MAVSDWDRRENCPDGACTGLIGPEGTCKVCGHAAPNWGDERKRGTIDEDGDEDDDDEDDEDDDEDSDDPIAPSTPVEIGGGEWSARQLCSDGSCVGVIGDDGKCKACGKVAGPAVARTPVEEDDSDEDEDESDDEDEDTAASDEEDDESDEDDEEDDEDEDDEEDDEDHEDLAAAADQLAGVASTAEVAAADALAGASKPEPKAKAKKPKSDDDRQLCPDGGCIGVIGADGKCKVCGKEAAA